ncbi:hypothetical protein PG990_014596 [Apiospora arundinis]
MTKPIQVWMAPPGPNPWKVIVILEELKVPYEIQSIRFENIKKKPFVDLNPNGRPSWTPMLTIWSFGSREPSSSTSSSSMTDKIMSGRSLREKHHLNQWLYFQASGQGPYFGQAGWFNNHHPDKLPSAIERYNNEVYRVLGVLDGCLEGKEWLVGDHITFADIVFAPWNDRLDDVTCCAPGEGFKGFPNVKAWHERGLTMIGIPKGMKSLQEWEKQIKEQDEAGSK